MQACPWSVYAPPVISFCEHRRCAFIAEPANAFSSFAYCIVGLWVLRRMEIPKGFRLMAAFGAIMVGLTSFVFHATATRVGEVLDVSSMYLLPALSLAVSLAIFRGKHTSRSRVAFLPVAVWLSATVSMLVFHNDGTLVFKVLVFLAIALDAWQLTRARAPGRFNYLLLSLGAGLAAFGIWGLDKFGIWCNPDNHFINGHAVWHCGTSFALAFHLLHIEAKFVRARS
jgi:hypothetical protein